MFEQIEGLVNQSLVVPMPSAEHLSHEESIQRFRFLEPIHEYASKRLREDERLLWKAYRDAFQGLSRALEDQLARDAGLSGSEYAVLVELSYAPGGVLRARELCALLDWDRSRLSHLVRRMEGRGLVVREECEEDARGSMVRLTAAGREAVDDADEQSKQAGISAAAINMEAFLRP